MVISQKKYPHEEVYFQGTGLGLVTASQYLGALIGNQAVETACIDNIVLGWIEFMKVMDGVARHQPQTSYDGMQNYLQQECDFFHCVTPGVDEVFLPMEESQQKFFLSSLSCGATTKITARGMFRVVLQIFFPN